MLAHGTQQEVVRILDEYTAAHDELVRQLEEEMVLREQQLSIARNELLTRDGVEYKALGEIGELVKGWGIAAGTCGEIADLERYGIEHNRCVDDRLMVKCFSHDAELMKFIGAKFVPGDPLFGVEDKWEPGPHKKDPGQRLACGCIMSKDIGEYNTCPHLCHYCYANTNNAAAMENCKRYCQRPSEAMIVEDVA